MYYIGTNDRTTALFEGMWPLPQGISYNSYLIADEKTAVIDCVGPEHFAELLANIRAAIGGRAVDYIIVNHMEPDHSGALALFRQQYPHAVIVGNKKTVSMAEGYYGIGGGCRAVTDGESLPLGRRTLTFRLTPMVHWPETMMAYDDTSATLFSGDAFGCFGALNGAVKDADTDPEPYFPEMRRYYSNIVGKYAAPVQNALKRLASAEIRMICPTHGPVWTECAGRVIAEYGRMSRYEAAEEGAVVVYASMYGNTRRMAEEVARGISSAGVRRIAVRDAARTPLSFILSDIFSYRGLAVGAATYNGDVSPSVRAVMEAVGLREVKGRVMAAFGSFTWAGKAVKAITGFADRMGYEQPAPAVEMRQGFGAAAAAECFALGRSLGEAVKSRR